MFAGNFGNVNGQNYGNWFQPDVNSDLNRYSNTGDKAILEIYSNTNWSGALEDSTFGSNTIDGNGNRYIHFECSGFNGIYSAGFQKHSEGGYLILVVIQNGKLLGSKSTSAQYGVVSVSGTCEPNVNGSLLVAIVMLAGLIIIIVLALRSYKNKKVHKNKQL